MKVSSEMRSLKGIKFYNILSPAMGDCIGMPYKSIQKTWGVAGGRLQH